MPGVFWLARRISIGEHGVAEREHAKGAADVQHRLDSADGGCQRQPHDEAGQEAALYLA